MGRSNLNNGAMSDQFRRSQGKQKRKLDHKYVKKQSNAKAEVDEIKSDGVYVFLQIAGGLLAALAVLYSVLYYSV